PYVWHGGTVETPAEAPDAVICATLPARQELAALAAVSPAPPLVLLLASQLAYMRSIATLTPLTLSSAADRAQDRAELLRARIAARLTAGNVDAELAVLQPLFESRDPAEVAGALLALQREQAAASSEQTSARSADVWTTLFVTIGRQDRATPKDLVGALIREVGLEKAQIGRIEMKDTFSLIDIAPAAAEQAARRLTGVAIRGRRVNARLDRSR
ncbi:MAG: DbpA RNA binding domain-containing protein, partial [Gemmatimonadales bacterium]